MSFANLLVERDGHVAVVTVNRPAKLNALDNATFAELMQCFTELGSDAAVGAVILTGAGEKAFIAGADIEMLSKQGVLDGKANAKVGQCFTELLESLPKPVIAAVNGLAWAGGFLLAQMCDLCIAADHATFGITEARWGRGAPWAAPLPWLVPPRVALELLVTADPIDARRAYEVGLVNRVVPKADLRAASQEMALRIAGNAPLSVRAGKALVYAAAELGWHEALDEGDRLFDPVYRSQDAQEGPLAFREKRKPRWSGR